MSDMTQRIMDFMNGAAWWLWEMDGRTMFQTEQNEAIIAAKKRFEREAERAAIYAERGESDPLIEHRRQKVESGEMGMFLCKIDHPDSPRFNSDVMPKNESRDETEEHEPEGGPEDDPNYYGA